MPTFTPTKGVAYGSNRRTTYRVLSNSFGDGYSQDVKDGLNNVVEIWDLVWTGITLTQASNIIAQLNSFGGTTFDWTNPHGVLKKYTCTEVTDALPTYNAYNVSATFTESFS